MNANSEKKKYEKRILLISPFFPPDNSPQAVQSYRLASALANYGHQVSIATCATNFELQNNSHGIDYKSFKLNKFTIFNTVVKISKFRSKYSDKVYRFFRPYDPALQLSEILQSIKSAVSKSDYDVVISIAEPLVSHVALLRFKSFFEKSQRIIWFSDPPPLERHMLKTSWRRRAVSQLLDQICVNTDAVISVTDEIMDYLPKNIISKKSKFVLSHVYDPYDWNRIDEIKIPNKTTQNIDILHSGALYWLRRPNILLDAVKIAQSRITNKNIHVNLQGTISPEIEKYINNLGNINYNLIGASSLADSLLEMRKSDILCVIDVELEKNIHLPSKIADYVAARKPILYIGNSNSPTCRALKEFHPAFESGNNPEEVANAIIRLIKKRSKLKTTDFDVICSRFNLNTAYQNLQHYLVGVHVTK